MVEIIFMVIIQIIHYIFCHYQSFINQKSFAVSSGKHLIVKEMLLQNVVLIMQRNLKLTLNNHTNQCAMELVQLVIHGHVGLQVKERIRFFGLSELYFLS